MPNGKVDSRRIEITFHRCYLSLTGHHKDNEGVEAIGYRIDDYDPPRVIEYLDWREQKWRQNGFCPDPEFSSANPSAWLESLPDRFRQDASHYVIDGRDGYVELIAEGYEWKEWIWNGGHRDEVPLCEPVFDQGTSE